MPDERIPNMPDLTVRELKTEMNARFAAVDAHLEAIDRRISEEAAATRRHFDIVAESMKAENRLMFEGADTRLDDHERRIQALEKRRR
jgi:hypothetical protein